MGNCMRKKQEPSDVTKRKGKKGLKDRKKGKKDKKDKSKSKSTTDETKNGEKREKSEDDQERNGKTNGLDDHRVDDEEPIKVVKVIPLESETVFASNVHATVGPVGPQERKVLRLVLPYIPKKQWGNLKRVCQTWKSVVEGEWARMHTLHLTELLPTGGDRREIDSEKSRQLADHLGSKCQLSRGLLCLPPYDERGKAGTVDLSDEEFWRRLQPRTADLQTIKLHGTRLPKYFFTNFLPRCKNLEVLEIMQAPDQDQGKEEQWTESDREQLNSTFAGFDKLKHLNLSLSNNHLNPKSAKYLGSFPFSREVNLIDNSESTQTFNPVQSNFRTDNVALTQNSNQVRRIDKIAPIQNSNHRDIEFMLNKSAGPNLKSFVHDQVPLTPNVLKSLTSCLNLTSLSFDLNLDLLNPYSHDHLIRNCFSAFQYLQDLRINVVSNENNVYETLQTLSLILNTVAEHSKQLTVLKLIRLPDPMGIDKPLATDFSTAFVKLNSETQLDNLHVCVSAPRERFHAWSLPWSALTRLRTLTLTDCNSYPERPRGIDLAAMPSLTTFTLCSDSLDDDTLTRVFAQPNATILDLTLEPGPKGIGKRGMCTVAVACQGLQHLTISYTRGRVAGDGYEHGKKHTMDAQGWKNFFRAVPDTLKTLTLIDTEPRYVHEVVAPTAAVCPFVTVRPIYEKASFDTYAEFRSLSNGKHSAYE